MQYNMLSCPQIMISENNQTYHTSPGTACFVRPSILRPSIPRLDTIPDQGVVKVGFPDQFMWWGKPNSGYRRSGNARSENTRGAHHLLVIRSQKLSVLHILTQQLASQYLFNIIWKSNFFHFDVFHSNLTANQRLGQASNLD